MDHAKIYALAKEFSKAVLLLNTPDVLTWVMINATTDNIVIQASWVSDPKYNPHPLGLRKEITVLFGKTEEECRNGFKDAVKHIRDTFQLAA